MDTRLKIINGLIGVVLLAVLSVQVPVFAKSASASAGKGDKQRYIVVLDDLPLVAYDGRVVHTPERNTTASSFKATANKFTGARKLDHTGSHIGTMYKDLGITMNMAKENGAAMFATAAAYELFRSGISLFPDEDNWSIVKLLEQIAGTEVTW